MQSSHNKTPETPTKSPPKSYPAEVPGLAGILEEEKGDRRALRIATGVAVVLHAVLLVTQFPALTSAEPPPPPDQKEPYVIQQVRIKQPPPPEPEPEPPKPEKKPAPKPEAKKVPIPDPTPREPEPIVEPTPPEPEILEPTEIEEPVETTVELPPTDTLMEIPEAPAPPPAPEPPQGPILVGGDVKAPEKISGADPQYPEAARQARIEGVVIVKAVIDKQGRVTDVEIVKDLPMGLGSIAADAVESWEFRPATLHGEPVEVYYNLTVRFSVN